MSENPEIDAPSSGESEDELQRARLAAERSEQELGVALRNLGHAIREPFGIAAKIREAPTPWLVGAFAVGFLLARSIRR